MTSPIVTICMLTYKRPVLLEQALLSIAGQQMLQNSDVTLRFVLVDNDSEGSARMMFERIQPAIPFESRYVIESQQGIACARNRALDEAQGADFIALLDDDETASASWIDSLLTVQRTSNADVVTGPVTPSYEDAPPWIVKGRFFASREMLTGAPVHFVETNNVLIAAKWTKQFHFDLRFNTTSGEDTYFFMQLEQAGAKMVWAADATVWEHIPRKRTSATWLLDRAQSDANRYTRACLYMSPGPLTVGARICKAIAAFGAGVLLLLTGIAGRHRAIKALRLISRSIGTMRALLGFSHLYYAPGQPLR